MRRIEQKTRPQLRNAALLALGSVLAQCGKTLPITTATPSPAPSVIPSGLVPCVNGCTFTNITTTNSNLPSNSLTSVAVLGSAIYVGSNMGVSMSTNGGATWTTYNAASNSLASDTVNAIAVTPGSAGNNLYVATAGGFSQALNGATLFSSVTSFVCSENSSAVTAIAVADLVFLGLSNSVWDAALGSTTFNSGYSNGYPTCNYPATVVFTDPLGYAYASSGNNVLYRSPGATNVWSSLGSSVGPSYNGILSGVVNGNIYLGTSTAGVFIYDTSSSSWNQLSTSGLPSLSVNALAMSSAGADNLYAGSSNGLGVSLNGGSSWTTFTTANGLMSNSISALFVSGSSLYIATTSGLSIAH